MREIQRIDWLPKLAFAAFICAFVFFEGLTARREQIMRELEYSIVEISDSPYSSQNDGKLVFFQTNRTSFNLLQDDEFGLSEYAGKLERKVQYCQWRESRISHTHRRGNKTYTTYSYSYHKGWYYSQMSSIFYHNPIYHNPSVVEIPQTTFQKPMQAGDYMVETNMGLNGRTNRFQPHSQQILQFDQSFMSRTFKYAGRGIFYREYKRGFLETVLRVATFFDTENSELFEWCTPGDTRVWYDMWAPPSVTVVGKKNQNNIGSINFKGYQIGAAYAGIVPLKKVLESNTSWFPTIMKWIIRVVIIGYFVLMYIDSKNVNFFLLGGIALVFAVTHTPIYNELLTSKKINALYSAIAGIVFTIVCAEVGKEK